jgi:hypothetical protein
MHAPWLTYGVLIALCAVGPFAVLWLARRPRTTATLLGTAVLGTAALTLYPAGAPSSSVTCNVGLPYVNSLAVESTANILLFVPIALLAAVRWRRPMLAVLGTSLLSFLSETVQAFVAGIGRACDTSDWITNTVGAIVGGTLAIGGLAKYRRRTAKVRTSGATSSDELNQR